jgi:hypothetical protein
MEIFNTQTNLERADFTNNSIERGLLLIAYGTQRKIPSPTLLSGMNVGEHRALNEDALKKPPQKPLI